MNESLAETLRVLLVEDNPGDARLVTEFLREPSAEQVTVRHVTRIADATAALEETDYDVILLDLSLPDGMGVVTVQRIRAGAPHVPIVILTGLGDETAAIDAVQEGAQDYLVKGDLEPNALLRAIRYAIGRHQRMHRIAYYDALTTLPNRALFRDRLTQAVQRGRRYGDRVGLLFVDLDGFKDVNDTLGHDAGDAVLRAAARRMRECLRSSDVVARYGGDEFVVVLPTLPRESDAYAVAEKVRACVAAPLSINGIDVTVGASVGVALFPAEASDVDELIALADAAMYRAKQQGKNRVA